MKRENLEFLENEQIDKVMALYGKAIAKKDNEIETLKTDKKELEDKVTTYETKINEFNESAKDNADWKSKYEELQTSIKEQEAKKQAEEQVKIQLVIEQITKVEEIKATEEEIDVKIAEQAIAMGKDAEEFKKTLNERQIAYFENNVVIDKVFAFLTANNIID